MPTFWDILYAGAGVVSSPVWGYHRYCTGKWRTDWHGRMGHGAALPPCEGQGRRLLIHGVSVGEINAIRSLVELLHQRDPGLQMVISSTTDTGFAQATKLFGSRDTVVRYPLDFSRCVRRFLDRIQPTAVALVELEIWPNFMAACAARSIPVSVINGRLSAHSFRWYRLGRPLVRPSFAALTAAAVQTEEYAQRFRALGAQADRVHVLDTMKWDTAKIVDQVPGADDLARAMGIDRSEGRPLIVAGSTGPGEEELLIRTCPPEAQLLLVPRKPERFDEVATLAPGIICRTRCPDGIVRPVDGNRLFLLDTMGELGKAYALADVVLVGRSFLGLYGSDLIDPIALGKPTIIGPYHKNFSDVVAAMQAGKGLVVSADPGAEAARLLADPVGARQLGENGRRVIRTRQGSTARHAEMLLGVMEARLPRSPLQGRGSVAGTPAG